MAPLTEETQEEWGIRLRMPPDWPECVKTKASFPVEVLSRKTGLVIDTKVFQKKSSPAKKI